MLFVLGFLIVLVLAAFLFYYFAIYRVTVTTPGGTNMPGAASGTAGMVTVPGLEGVASGTNGRVNESGQVDYTVIQPESKPIEFVPTSTVIAPEAPTSVAPIVIPPPVTSTPPNANIPLPVPTAPTSVAPTTPAAPTAPTTTSATPACPNPTLDSDKDGLPDCREAELGTDPHKADTDGDGLSDGDEVLKYGTNPLNPDTDVDGYPDGVEVRGGYNPRGAGKCSKPDCTL